MRHRHLGALSLVSLLTACESEHLRIGTDLGHPLCAGDLAAFEAIVHRAEDELGFSMTSKYSVSIWSDEAWPTVRSEYCRTGPRTLGCIDYGKRSIYTSLSAVDHELAHAAIPIPKLTPFFAEGLADVYSGRHTRFGHTAPADSLALSAYDVDRWMARHFVRWLRETWGGAKLGELASLGKHADTRFDEVYGLSFADAQARYFDEAPFGYSRLDACDGASLDLADDLGSWRAVVGLDCDAGEDVRALGIGRMALRTLVIPVAGYYSVSTDADAILLSRCATGPIEAPVRNEDFLGEDVPPSYAGYLTEAFAMYEGSLVLDLYFKAGKHEIGLFLVGYEGGEAVVAIGPSMGPRPVEGGL